MCLYKLFVKIENDVQCRKTILGMKLSKPSVFVITRIHIT